MPTLDTAVVYPGMVLFEGTNLSEGRGTTRPFEFSGAPWIDGRLLARQMNDAGLPGARFRAVGFEPTFQKHAGKLCAGFQIHVEGGAYDHEQFRPWRLMAAALKALRILQPDYELWRRFAYEYEHDRLAIDLINGSELMRQWVDDPVTTAADLDRLAIADEAAWRDERDTVLLYR
jgi:uncharacterized protein YbbC (DUF1343 family)